MKLAVFFVAVVLSSRIDGKPSVQGGLEINGITSQIMETVQKNMEVLVSQMSVLQETFTSFNRLLGGMVSTSTRLIAGLNGEDKSSGSVPTNLKSVMKYFEAMTDDMELLQKAVNEINGQLATVGLASSRLAATTAADSEDLPLGLGLIGQLFETFTKNLNIFTGQIAQLQNVMTALNENFSRLVSTGTRIVTGVQSNESNQPGTAIFEQIIQSITQNLAVFTKQVAVVQDVVTRLNQQVGNMVSQGTRLVAGLAADAPDLTQPLSIIEGIFSTLGANLGLVRDQVSVVNSLLTQLNLQFTRFLGTTTRTLAGLEGVPGEGASRDQLLDPGVLSSLLRTVVSNLQIFTNQAGILQRVLTQINGQFARFVSDGTRLVGGVSAENSTATGKPAGTIASGAADLASIVKKNLEILVAQIAVMREMVANMGANLNKIIRDPSRIVSGLQVGDSIPNLGSLGGIIPQLIGTITQNFAIVTQQIQALQLVATNVNLQLTKLLDTGTRMVAGLQSEDQDVASKPADNVSGLVQSFYETLTKNLAVFAKVASDFQSSLTDLNEQFTRFVGTGTRLITGLSGETNKTAVEEKISNEANFLERLLQELRQEVEKLIASVNAVDADKARPKRQIPFTNPIEMLAQIFQVFGRILDSFTSQIRSMVTGLPSIATGLGENRPQLRTAVNVLDQLRNK